MNNISWKNQEKLHKKEYVRNARRYTKKRRKTIQVRLIESYHGLLKKQSKTQGVTLSKLLETIVKDYLANGIIEEPDNKFNNLKTGEDNGNLLSGDI